MRRWIAPGIVHIASVPSALNIASVATIEAGEITPRQKKSKFKAKAKSASDNSNLRVLCFHPAVVNRIPGAIKMSKVHLFVRPGACVAF